MDRTWVLPQINLLFLFKMYLFIIACNTNKYPVMYPGFHARLHLPVKSKLHEWMRQEFEKPLHKFGLSCWTHSFFCPEQDWGMGEKDPWSFKNVRLEKKHYLPIPHFFTQVHCHTVNCICVLCFPTDTRCSQNLQTNHHAKAQGSEDLVRSKNYLLAVDTKQIACMRWSMACDFKYC